MQLPASFGSYELLERIATGGMAEVFLARSIGVAGFEKRLVIKRIRPEFAEDPRFIQMFVREAKIGVHLNHPNVVQTYDLGKEGSTWFMAMEHLPGRDLNKWVKALRAEGQRVPVHLAVGIVAEVLHGLAYAHDRSDGDGQRLGLVHRDVSPHNVLLTCDGQVKLVDFGIARLMNTLGDAPQVVQPGQPGGGKYAYMSPEQALSRPVDHRTDVFAAGIVLWELLVGHRLFEHPDPAEKLRLVREAVIPNPADEGLHIDPDLYGLVLKALAKHPTNRYSTASDFEQALRGWLHAQPTTALSFRDELAAGLKQAFPDLGDRTDQAIDLERLVQDIAELDPEPKPSVPPPPSVEDTPSERKHVVVLSIEIVGLTQLSLSAEPEQVVGHHYQLLRWMRRIVDRYQGHIQRAIDDQITVLFGVPKTQPGDLSRALDCSLELQSTVGELARKGLSVQLAIGVHSGEMVLAPSARTVRSLSCGDSTQLARRLGALAGAGQTLVSERVFHAAQKQFVMQPGPKVRVRSQPTPVPAFALVRRQQGVQVTGRGAWIRRGNELDAISAALVTLTQGRGGVIGLVGDPGTGKSRLVRELRDLALRRSVPMIVARSTPYAKDPYLETLRALIGQWLGLDRSLSAAQLHRRMGNLAVLTQTDHHAIAWLYGLAFAKHPAPSRAKLTAAIENLLVRLAGQGPVIVAIEDLHLLQDPQPWIHLAGRLRDKALVLVTLTGALPKGLNAHSTAIELAPFDSGPQQRLMRNLLGVDALDPALTDLMARTCEGNPLYIHEMINHLLRQGRVATDGGVGRLLTTHDAPLLPEPLAELIAARIDALAPEYKSALQLAATIGVTFSSTLLADALETHDAHQMIQVLSEQGLVEPVHATTWTFSSELIHASATRSILKDQRQHYHHRIAKALQANPSDHPSHALTLGAHCAAAGRLLDAARHAFTGGEQLYASQQLPQARQAYQSGLGYLAQVPTSPATFNRKTQGEALLNLHYGRVSRQLSDTDAALVALPVALDIASDAGYGFIENQAHLELARVYLDQRQLTLAGAHLDQLRSRMVLADDPELTEQHQQATARLAKLRQGAALASTPTCEG